VSFFQQSKRENNEYSNKSCGKVHLYTLLELYYLCGVMVKAIVLLSKDCASNPIASIF